MESIDCRKIALSRLRSKKFLLRDEVLGGSSSGSIRTLPPLCVVAVGDYFEVVDGNRRLQILKKKSVKQVSALVLPNASDRDLLLTALHLNHPHGFSDLDRCLIFKKAGGFGFSEAEILKQIFPLVGLMSGPKVLTHYLQISTLPEYVLKLIRSGALPFQGSHWLSKFSAADLKYLCASVFPKIRPSANQLAHMAEWLADLTRGQSSKVFFNENSLIKKCRSDDLRQAAGNLYKLLRALRFPDLTAKEMAFEKAAQSLKGGVTGLDFKAPDHFEREGFFIHAHIRNPDDLRRVLERLRHIQDDVTGLFDTVL